MGERQVRVISAVDPSRAWPTSVLLGPWQLWRLLDRLSCQEWVEVKSRPIAPDVRTRFLPSARSSFWMHVFPHRVASDGLQSSKTPATKRAYCAVEFQNELDAMRLRYAATPPLRV